MEPIVFNEYSIDFSSIEDQEDPQTTENVDIQKETN